MREHEPVLVREVVRWLEPRAGGLYVDATVGAGGHAAAILACGPTIRVVGVDWDEDALAAAAVRLRAFGDRVRLERANFSQLLSLGLEKADGVLFDLGVSSLQLEAAERGLSFSRDGPLDMRLDRRLKLRASDLLARADEAELARILREYGDEPQARRIAAAIVRARAVRPLERTLELARIVEQVVPRKRAGRIAPATRTFMALRMAVNNELENLQQGLEAALCLLNPGGRLAVISFHSGEDRIVKNFLRREATDCLCPPGLPECRCGHRRRLQVLTSKPVRPSAGEVERNPRARSARLRVAVKLEESVN